MVAAGLGTWLVATCARMQRTQTRSSTRMSERPHASNVHMHMLVRLAGSRECKPQVRTSAMAAPMEQVNGCCARRFSYMRRLSAPTPEIVEPSLHSSIHGRLAPLLADERCPPPLTGSWRSSHHASVPLAPPGTDCDAAAAPGSHAHNATLNSMAHNFRREAERAGLSPHTTRIHMAKKRVS